MWLLGFTINTMTLLALALAVGVVIDDAIIVLENIERHREVGEAPREAASKGARQIAFAATAATLSVAAVFLPVVFVKGIVGSFLGEFGLTVAALGADLAVRRADAHADAGRAHAAAEGARARRHLPPARGRLRRRSRRGYRALLDWALAHRGATLGVALASFARRLRLRHAARRRVLPARRTRAASSS